MTTTRWDREIGMFLMIGSVLVAVVSVTSHAQRGQFWWALAGFVGVVLFLVLVIWEYQKTRRPVRVASALYVLVQIGLYVVDWPWYQDTRWLADLMGAGILCYVGWLAYSQSSSPAPIAEHSAAQQGGEPADTGQQ